MGTVPSGSTYVDRKITVPYRSAGLRLMVHEELHLGEKTMGNNDYKMVNTVEGIREYIGNSRIVALDLETSPDESFREDEKAALDPHRSHIVGCSFSVQEGTGIYVPVAHRIGSNIDNELFFGFLKELLTSRDIMKVIHNAVFESQMLYHLGIVISEPVYDTICASQMTLKNEYEFRELSDSGLKKLAGELCGEKLPGFTEVVRKGTDADHGGLRRDTRGHFDELAPDDPETVRYGCADADFALRLYRIFNGWFDRYLPKHKMLTEKIESPTAVYLGIMHHNGIPVDLSLMMARKKETDTDTERIRNEILAITGDLNIGSNCSTTAFKKYLYDDLGLPVVKTTETNREAADDMTMQLLQEWCADNKPELTPLFLLVQEYRRLGKISSTYINGYLKHLNPVTGRIHPDMFSLSTDTGRMKCRNPNCQNMPRKTNDPIGIRNFIKAPEGQVILSLDYSQIELRVGAFYCRDARMMETYRRGEDIHAATTSILFGISYEEAQDKNRPGYKEQRTIAKNVNFGTFYGLFPKGLQKTLKFKAGIDKTEDECREILENLKAGYPGLTEWQEETKIIAAKRGYTETRLGRRRYLPDINSSDWGRKAFSERCSLNTPIQGTAADILKIAITRILRGLPERPWLQPILQIHDELTFLVEEKYVKEGIGFVKECMEERPFPDFDVPLVAEASVGKTFGDMKEI